MTLSGYRITPTGKGTDAVVAGVVLQLDQSERFQQRRQVHAEPSAQALLLAVPAADRVVLGTPPRLDRAGSGILLLVGCAERHPVAVLRRASRAGRRSPVPGSEPACRRPGRPAAAGRPRRRGRSCTRTRAAASSASRGLRAVPVPDQCSVMISPSGVRMRPVSAGRRAVGVLYEHDHVGREVGWTLGRVVAAVAARNTAGEEPEVADEVRLIEVPGVRRHLAERDPGSAISVAARAGIAGPAPRSSAGTRALARTAVRSGAARMPPPPRARLIGARPPLATQRDRARSNVACAAVEPQPPEEELVQQLPLRHRDRALRESRTRVVASRRRTPARAAASDRSTRRGRRRVNGASPRDGTGRRRCAPRRAAGSGSARAAAHRDWSGRCSAVAPPMTSRRYGRLEVEDQVGASVDEDLDPQVDVSRREHARRTSSSR